jgi:putative hydrolase of the HAD superfamily
MIQLYIFDMGGVVARDTNVLEDVAASLEISLDELHVWTREFGRQIMEGRLSTREFWRIFSARSGLDVVEDLFVKFFRPSLNHEVIALIQHLKGQHRVVCGTNTIAAHYAHHLERGDYTVFDAVYASHLIGVAKPRPEFYHYILDREHCSPCQTVFVDDTLKNVEASRQLGISGIHFRNYEALLSELSRT